MTEAEKLAQFYSKRFFEKNLEDWPEKVPPFDGGMTRENWVERMEAVIDKLDEIRFERAAR